MSERKRKRVVDDAVVACLNVSVDDGRPDQSSYRFKESFLIGRDECCQIRLDHALVSREHAEIFFERNTWWVRDLKSTNGTYLDGQKIECEALSLPTQLHLGRNGPSVKLSAEQLPDPPSGPIGAPEPGADRNLLSQYEEYYLRDSGGAQAGDRTLFIRQAFQKVQRKQKRRHAVVIVCLTVLCLGVGSYALYQHRQADRRRQLAEDLFYAMKSLELEVAKSEETLVAFKGKEGLDEIRRNRSRRRELEENYNRFLREMKLYTSALSEEDRLVLRIVRIFGECELTMPKDFAGEVKRYIGMLQSTEKLAKAIRHAKSKGYSRSIASTMLEQDLPPQFFYLAFQESSFDVYACGPQTHKGIAKGMWQFIPETADKYRLRVGPLSELRQPDTADDRHDFEKSTQAASRYLKFIYTTEAQASGLLVMASYNWGEEKVIKLIRQLPANPRERNFWRLLAQFHDKIPQETYDYVFYIVAAAVIGENPRLFGFDFENPLGHLETGKGS